MLIPTKFSVGTEKLNSISYCCSSGLTVMSSLSIRIRGSNVVICL